MRNKFIESIRTVTPEHFDALALEIFQFQAVHNPIYARYLSLVCKNPAEITSVTAIPFLPIGLFKTYAIQTEAWEPVKIFESSGTSGMNASRHFVRDPAWYDENCLRGFQAFYGDPASYVFLSLLPSYLERGNSSLVRMMHYFAKVSGQDTPGFYLDDYTALEAAILKARAANIPVWLIGVTYALLDWAEKTRLFLESAIILETGGMKGRRRELIREELHDVLKKAFQISQVHSEYGMTELFSQAYAAFDGRFYPSPTLKVLPRPINDPFGQERTGRTGVLNMIDLANIDTCCFIGTEDLGRVFPDGSFEVLGEIG